MSQSLFFLWKECETLVHMAKTRVWYAIPDCSRTKLALLCAILNPSYTDFCWWKSRHGALKTGKAPRQKAVAAFGVPEGFLGPVLPRKEEVLSGRENQNWPWIAWGEKMTFEKGKLA